MAHHDAGQPLDAALSPLPLDAADGGQTATDALLFDAEVAADAAQPADASDLDSTLPDAALPEVEECNEIDDDGDGLIDETVPASQCGSDDVLRLCNDGVSTTLWCAASGQTCAAGDCTGPCTPGTFRCRSRKQSQKCDGTGGWNNEDLCSVTGPAERCDQDIESPSYGKCIPNDPYLVARAVKSDDAIALGDADLLAQPIDIPEDVTLVGFGMRTAPSPALALARAFVSLHVDRGGQPGALINAGGEMDPVAYDSGNLVGRVSNQPAAVQLRAGRRYWIVAKIFEPSSAELKIYVSAAGAEGNHRVGTQAYGAPGNLTPGATAARTGGVSLYLQVQK